MSRFPITRRNSRWLVYAAVLLVLAGALLLLAGRGPDDTGVRPEAQDIKLEEQGLEYLVPGELLA